MKRILLAITVLVGLSACDTMPGAGGTSAQKFYTAVAAYQVVQEAALGYARVCKDQHVPAGCEQHVKVMAAVNERGNQIIQAARSNTDQPAYLSASATALGIVYTEIQAKMLTAEGK